MFMWYSMKLFNCFCNFFWVLFSICILTIVYAFPVKAKMRSSSWWARFFVQTSLEENEAAIKKFEQAALKNSYKPNCQVFHLNSYHWYFKIIMTSYSLFLGFNPATKGTKGRKWKKKLFSPHIMYCVMISFATIDVNDITWCFVLNIIQSIKFINLIDFFSFFSVIFLFYSPFLRSSHAKQLRRKKRRRSALIQDVPPAAH